jgi:hypothetical protein
LAEGIGYTRDICTRVAPVGKERGNLFAIPLKNIKVQIKTQGAADSFKNHQRFILLGPIHPYHL